MSSRSHPTAALTPRLEDLLEQEGLQGGVQLLCNILQQDWKPELDGILQRA